MPLPPGFQEENLPEGFVLEGPEKAAPRTAPSPTSPPPPPGMLDKALSFLFGAPENSGSPLGGLSDVLPYSVTHPVKTVQAWAEGIRPLAEESTSLAPGSGTGILPGTVESVIPGGPIALGAVRDILAASKNQFQESREKGRGLVTSALSATPVIGPPATKVGEGLASEDPRVRAAALGSGTTLLAPFLAKPLGRTLGADSAAAKLEESAKVSMARALGPPTKRLATAAREVAPILESDDFRGKSPRQFFDTVSAKTNSAGRAVTEAIKAHGTEPIDKPALLARIDAAKQTHVNPLTNEPFTPEGASAVATLDDIKSQVDKNLGANPTVADLHRYRQALDQMVTKGAKEKMYSDLGRTGKLTYYKEAANVIRDVLNDAHEDIANANRNFTQWATARTIVREAKRSREAGEIVGGPPGGVYARMGLGGVALRMWHALTLRHSSRFQSLSSVEKAALSNAIKTGEFGDAAEAVLAANAYGKPKDKAVYFPALSTPPPAPPPDLEGIP